MMVATLSSRISFSRGVGSRLSSSIRTDSVSLEMRKRWTSSSNRSRPEGWSQESGGEDLIKHISVLKLCCEKGRFVSSRFNRFNVSLNLWWIISLIESQYGHKKWGHLKSKSIKCILPSFCGRSTVWASCAVNPDQYRRTGCFLGLCVNYHEARPDGNRVVVAMVTTGVTASTRTELFKGPKIFWTCFLFDRHFKFLILQSNSHQRLLKRCRLTINQ